MPTQYQIAPQPPCRLRSARRRARRRGMALAAGMPVTMGINVSRAFEDGEWDVYDGDSGPSLGGHCIMACGFSPKGIMCLNSWGPTWGRNGGFFWLSDRFVGSDEANDLCMVQVAPKEIE